jgi:hypothetical protein
MKVVNAAQRRRRPQALSIRRHAPARATAAGAALRRRAGSGGLRGRGDRRRPAHLVKRNSPRRSELVVGRSYRSSRPRTRERMKKGGSRGSTRINRGLRTPIKSCRSIGAAVIRLTSGSLHGGSSTRLRRHLVATPPRPTTHKARYIRALPKVSADCPGQCWKTNTAAPCTRSASRMR